MTVGRIYVNLLQTVMRTKADERVLEALRRGPLTMRGLANDLHIPSPVVSVAIGLLRKRGCKIEARDWSTKAFASHKGTYHLISEPKEGTL